MGKPTIEKASKRGGIPIPALVLTVIFLVAVAYRLSRFPENIYFGYDQARDAYESQRIYRERDLILLGPRTEVDGVFHSPLYYYIIGPLYLLQNGLPYLPVAFLLLVNALGVFLIYRVGVILFDKSVGLISALIYAFSFEQYQYAYYLSHPSLATTAVLVFYFGLALIAFRRIDWGWYIAVLGLALALHFELILVYLIPTFVVFIISFRLFKLTRRRSTIILAFCLLGLLMIPYFIPELQYDFRATKALLSFARSSSKVPELMSLLRLAFDKYSLHMYLNILGLSRTGSAFLVVAGFLFLILAKTAKTSLRFLLFWILGPLFLYVSSSQPVLFFFTNMGISSAFILLASYALTRIGRSPTLRLLLLSIVLAGNLQLWMRYGSQGLVNGWLAVQDGMLLVDEIRAVNYTYSSAAGEPFEIKVLSMPLKIQTTWSYLYQTFGLPRYGYLPSSVYGDALGFYGHFPSPSADTCFRYLVSEPRRGIADWFTSEFYNEEEGVRPILELKRFGSIEIQKRISKTCNP